MTRRLSRVETSCLEAMRNAPSWSEAATVALGTDVLMATGMMRSDAAKVASGLFDEYLKTYLGG
jgi:hypothetical protein